MWGTDATMFGTADGSLYWLFAVIDHYSDKVLGVHVVEQGSGDRARPALRPQNHLILQAKTTNIEVSRHAISPVAQRYSGWLLTTRLLVRIQGELD